MRQSPMAGFVAQTAAEFEVPGVAVGIWTKGAEYIACQGITDVQHGEPVDHDTLFLIASVTKTFTATAMMRLVTDGRVDLDAPVRRYLPDFTLSDERVAETITVLNLLNHSAGLDWRAHDEPNDADGALARYVAALRDQRLVSSPGARTSYSQIGFNVAGRIIEVVTGAPYEKAIEDLLLQPLGLRRSTFATLKSISGTVSMGHNRAPDGSYAAVRQWKDTRANNPGGGLACSVTDLLAWARFQLGEGFPVLPSVALQQMHQPTAKLVGSSLGDAVGIGWFLRDISGVQAIGHSGSANGQFAEVLVIPEKEFAVVTLANSGPDNGLAFNREIVQAALASVAGVAEPKVKVVRYRHHVAAEYAGVFENDLMLATFTDTGKALTAEFAIKPEVRSQASTELPPDMPTATVGLLRGERDHYVITDGGLKGQRGHFTRDEAGHIIAVDMAGRVFTRTS